MARAWIAEHPAPAASRDRVFREGVVMLASGMANSAIVRFAVVARDTTRIEAPGYLALARLSLGDRAVQLLHQANREGQQMPLWHCASALASLRGYAAIEAIIRPRR